MVIMILWHIPQTPCLPCKQVTTTREESLLLGRQYHFLALLDLQAWWMMTCCCWKSPGHHALVLLACQWQTVVSWGCLSLTSKGNNEMVSIGLYAIIDGNHTTVRRSIMEHVYSCVGGARPIIVLLQERPKQPFPSTPPHIFICVSYIH